jgi:phenylpyruvate tautomerase PptA (4-oxalocrotonate tautomerase family)
MFHKLILAISGLFVIFGLCTFPLLAAEISMPVPKDAVKVSDKIIDIGPIRSNVEVYQSYLAENRIKAFYKKEMLRAGWTQNKSGLFMKDNCTAAITFSPLRNQEGAVQFMVVTSKVPSPEEILAERKENPDKLEFMPVYPACAQNFLWDNPSGMSASYETEDSVKEIVFFYKSRMPSYGWELYSEIPIKEEKIDSPVFDKLKKPVISTSATLRFYRKRSESCVIMINSVSGANYLLEGEQVVNENAGSAPKSTIVVVYNK